MMATGSTRLVRYIAMAILTLGVFYFVTHSKYEGVSISKESFSSGGWAQSPPQKNADGSVRPGPGSPAEAPIKDAPKTEKAPDIDDGSQYDSSKVDGTTSELTEDDYPYSDSSKAGSSKTDSSKAGSTKGEPLKTDFSKGDSSSKSGSSKPASGDASGHGSSSQLIEESEGRQHPLALTPNDPGWDDLVSIDAGPRMNATFVTLARNSDVWEIAKSIRQVEDRFNRRYNYDWVFLNDQPFDDTFKKVTTSLVSGTTHYGEIPEEHWSFPEWIDQDKAKKVREDMKARQIIYGDSVSYRHMCRFESGFFFRHPIMMNYEYYWRVEPSIELYCDIHYDPFRVMVEEGKKYSFVLSLYEYAETIPTIWDSAKKFMKNHPEHVAKDNSMKFLSDDGGETYNRCHFWSNFEVGSLDWLRSDAYVDFFDTLDYDGGFFYERWGDAPVHSIAASILLNKSEIKFFDDIAYFHVPFTHCPTDDQTRIDLRCHCDPSKNFDWKGYSCTSRFFEMNNMKKPKGYESQKD